ncbi:MAG: GTP 3',8-cyclase MoaA [Bacteroidales bacterium]|nr:GTP 3',8-cyclase MoaA [Bacteroidales bacterium]
MFDSYNRRINYLRISVTDRCNLRCVYCMPEDGIELMKHEDILSFEEIERIVVEGVARGITKVRLTGGEPLVRKNIVSLVKMIAAIEGVEDLSMTTNGILLAQFARALKEAGLHRVNISLDTLSPERYSEITRGGNIHKVLEGIQAAKAAGLSPIKINCVVFKNKEEHDAQSVAKYCRENDLQVRFIHQMNLETGEFSVVDGGEGGNCSQCNRLRLTANGEIKPCLFNELAYNVKEQGISSAYREALRNKPKTGTRNKSGKFYGIGG